MVNLVITNQCQSNCPFCFARGVYDKPQKHMRVSDVLRLMPLVKNESITLLGGEPTQHPQFLDILEIVYKQAKNVFVLSNGLAEHKLYEKILSKWKTHFLINVQSAEYSRIFQAKEHLLETFVLFRKKNSQLISLIL